MSRCCLTVGLFLGLLARSFQPLAAADSPPVDAGKMPTRQDAGGTPTPLSAQDPSDVPLVAPAVRQAMQDRHYAEARKAIDEAAKAKDAPSDYLAYLRAWSLSLDKQHDQAIAALEKFAKDYPQSTWLRRTRFAKAQAMLAKGDFRGAQAIYEQEAKYLLSAARRQQSAAVYLEFADARFQPKHFAGGTPAPQDADQQPDYKSAGSSIRLPWMRAWRPSNVRTPSSASAIVCRSSTYHAEAAKAYQQFLAAQADDPRQMEARYRMGECLLAAGRLPEARKTWRELLKTVNRGGEQGTGSGEQGAGGGEQGAGSKRRTEVHPTQLAG